MGLKVIITGSTGMIGKGVLLECIDDPRVESILVINRTPVDITHRKVKEVVISDFFKIDSISQHLNGYDACFFCLGVTSVGMNEADYSRLTHDLTVDFANKILEINPALTFCYVSGAGTDTTESGKSMWARVKGKTENDLFGMGFRKAYMFRPALIRPMRGIRSRTLWYNITYTFIRPFSFILKRFPKYVSDTSSMGKAMINVGLYGYHKNILESEDINAVAVIGKL